MDIHKNARLSFRSREALARFVIEQGATRKAAAAAFRVSAKTAAKWVARFRLAGVEGLHGPQFAAAPQPAPLGISLAVAGRRAAPGTHARIPDRPPHRRQPGLRQPHPAPRTAEPLARPQPAAAHPALRAPRPGDLLHLDIKGMTRFSEVSLRGDGRLRGKQKHPGFLALHVAVDDHSRMAFTQMLPDQKAETTIGFLHSAVDFFATPRHRRARPAHRQRLQLPLQPVPPGLPASCSSSTTAPDPTPPEPTARPNASSRPHCASGPMPNTGPTPTQRDAALQPWTDYYNRERPHGSLNYKPPISRSDSGTTS